MASRKCWPNFLSQLTIKNVYREIVYGQQCFWSLFLTPDPDPIDIFRPKMRQDPSELDISSDNFGVPYIFSRSRDCNYYHIVSPNFAFCIHLLITAFTICALQLDTKLVHCELSLSNMFICVYLYPKVTTKVRNPRYSGLFVSSDLRSCLLIIAHTIKMQ